MSNNFKDDELAELLNAAANGPSYKPRKNAHRADIDLFIDSKGLTPSKDLIPFIEVYSAYKEWSKDPVSALRFSKLMATRFTRKRTNGTKCFLMLPGPLGLSDDFNIRQVLEFKRHLKGGVKEEPTNYIGVYKLSNGKYRVKLILPTGRYIALGSYKELKIAALSYDNAALQLYGKEALVNFPRIWKGIIDGTKAWTFKKDFTKKEKTVITKYFWKVFKETFKEQEQDSE